MSETRREMDELRQRWSELDREILNLLVKRARLSREVGARHAGPAKLPSSERDTLDALVAAAGDELPAEAVRSIFREIHSTCRALEASVRVVYVGAEAGQAAARKQFGPLAQIEPAATAAQALEQLADKSASFAVLPYESYTEGSIPSTLQALRFSDAHIIALIDEDRPPQVEGHVRFCVAALRPASRTGRDVTALLFTINDQPGALFEILKHFAERGVNLRKIQSRPSAGEGYVFFIEVSGHITDRSVVAAIEGVKAQTRALKILGSFPA
ncbi:MAG: chorismate mutase [Myxococcales bacterium]|nr:chorismate mutase [Polyangiaceae bacterium]MDW8249257.1 chorismate mutase [Myxococcales bacterium]